ncbi:MAG: 30S ribosomal protein S1 [Myxococcota bacterium]|jgi:small subunit ribosomal protein S1|nr:30S ribosomal protein S1 [Myxococcota bacterium]
MTQVSNSQSQPDLESFESLLAQFEQDTKSPREGDIVPGRVVDLAGDYVIIDIGFKSEGQVPKAEFAAPEGGLTIKIGDTVDVLVEAIENESGLCVLSKEKADRLMVWEEIAKAAELDETVEGTIVGRVKGGLSVDIGVRAFLPGSQVELRPTRNLDKFIGQRYRFKIIKFNKKRGNIVLSRRALLEKERAQLKAKTLERLREGSILDGVVKNITEYGAFVDLGGIDGLLHITDMSWGRVLHPTEVVNIGDEIKVKVLKFNPDNERVSLGYKQLMPDPWEHAAIRYPANIRALGRVVSLIDYGAFVELEEGIEGLIHISEMSWTRRVKHPSRVVTTGDLIDVVVLNIDAESKKISLGMKQTEPNPWELLEEKYPVGTRIIGKIRNITDFGLFIGVEDGIDGLVHVSDISWTQKIRNPAEIYKRGDEVEAVVLNIDVDNERFSLGIKQLTPDPWETLPERFPPGSIVDCKITKLTEFGAFASLDDGIEGLIHISELSRDRVDEPSQVVQVGEAHRAEVISIDPVDRKIALSIKSFVRRSETGTLRSYIDDDNSSTAHLGDLLKDKLSELVKTGEEEEEE